MTQLARGTKHRCTHCGAPFYDLNRDPIICPKCDKVFQPLPVAPRGRPPRPLPEPVVVDPEVFEEDEVVDRDSIDEDDAGEEEEAGDEPQD